MISSVNTKIGGIFGDWKINFKDWRKERSFLILTSRSGLSGTDTQSIRVLQVKYVSNTYYMAAMCPHRPHTSAPSSITPGHPALSLSPSFIQHLSLYPKPWRGSHLSPTIKHLHLAGASPEDAGDRRRRAAAPQFIFLLGARRFPNLFLHLPQTPSKKSKLELHQVISSISELLLV